MAENLETKVRPALTPDILLRAYATGIFPMSEGRDTSDIFWVDPTERGVFPLDQFHISRSLAKTLRAEPYKVSFDTDFPAVVRACADREETWINAEIIKLYSGLHRIRHAHSVEVWDGPDLVGGVYGVALGAAFFGESMFSRRTDASKIALAYLVTRLKAGGYRLFDTQFLTSHLASLGAIEVTRLRYHKLLSAALQREADFYMLPQHIPVQDVLQLRTQTS